MMQAMDSFDWPVALMLHDFTNTSTSNGIILLSSSITMVTGWHRKLGSTTVKLLHKRG